MATLSSHPPTMATPSPLPALMTKSIQSDPQVRDRPQTIGENIAPQIMATPATSVQATPTPAVIATTGSRAEITRQVLADLWDRGYRIPPSTFRELNRDAQTMDYTRTAPITGSLATQNQKQNRKPKVKGGVRKPSGGQTALQKLQLMGNNLLPGHESDMTSTDFGNFNLVSNLTLPSSVILGNNARTDNDLHGTSARVFNNNASHAFKYNLPSSTHVEGITCAHTPFNGQNDDTNNAIQNIAHQVPPSANVPNNHVNISISDANNPSRSGGLLSAPNLASIPLNGNIGVNPSSRPFTFGGNASSDAPNLTSKDPQHLPGYKSGDNGSSLGVSNHPPTHRPQVQPQVTFSEAFDPQRLSKNQRKHQNRKARKEKGKSPIVESLNDVGTTTAITEVGFRRDEATTSRDTTFYIPITTSNDFAELQVDDDNQTSQTAPVFQPLAPTDCTGQLSPILEDSEKAASPSTQPLPGPLPLYQDLDHAQAQEDNHSPAQPPPSPGEASSTRQVFSFPPTIPVTAGPQTPLREAGTGGCGLNTDQVLIPTISPVAHPSSPAPTVKHLRRTKSSSEGSNVAMFYREASDDESESSIAGTIALFESVGRIKTSLGHGSPPRVPHVPFGDRFTPPQFLVWNVRGIVSQSSFQRLRLLLRKHHPLILCLLEPFCGFDKLESFKVRLGFDSSFAGANGKLWLLWNSDLSLNLESESDQSVSVSCSHASIPYAFWTTFVYAKTKERLRTILWTELCSVSDRIPQDVISAQPIPKHFIFLNVWTKHEDFLRVVSESWDVPVEGAPMYVLATKLSRLQKALVPWNKESFGNIFTKLQELEDKVQLLEDILQQNPDDDRALIDYKKSNRHRRLRLTGKRKPVIDRSNLTDTEAAHEVELAGRVSAPLTPGALHGAAVTGAVIL
nr:phospholipid-transporting ATPase 2-like [Ipomoea batatas]